MDIYFSKLFKIST